MATNIITAQIKGRSAIADQHAYQYDYGMILRISGVDLPTAYQVDFSNEPIRGTAYQQIGNADGVAIPDACFESGDDIFAWVYLHSGEDDGETVYQIMIPVYKRSKTSGETPTPAQQSAIDEAIAALNEAVESADASAVTATEAAAAAAESAAQAATSAEGVEHYAQEAAASAEEAAGYVVTASEYASQAAASATAAASSAASADQSADEADTSADAAAISATNAATSATAASGSATTATQKASEAVASATAASGSASAASGSATQAAASATAASQSATAAAGSATEAASSATAASNSATTASTKADEAAASAAEAAETAAGITADLMNKADVITDTASGSIVSIPDGIAAPALDVKVNIDPVQDLHGYSSPWPAGGDSNQWDEDWTIGEINNSTGEAGTGTLFITNSFIPVVAGQTYYWKSPYGGTRYFYDSNKAFLQTAYGTANATFTAPEGASYMKFKEPSQYGSTYNHDIAVNYPATVTTYSPYSNTCPITGHDSVNVNVVGKNRFDSSLFSDGVIGLKYVSFPIENGYYTMSTPDFPYRGNLSNVLFFAGRVAGGGTSSANGVAQNKPITVNVIDGYFTVAYRTTVTGNTNNPKDFKWQIESGSTATTYEPYQCQTITIQLGQTVYGGTLDVTDGKLTVDRIKKVLTEYETVGGGQTGANSTRIGVLMSDAVVDNTKLKCNIMATNANADSTDTFGICGLKDSSGNIYIFFRTPAGLANNAARLAWLVANGCEVVYPIATPTEIQLTPEEIQILQLDNNIWSDTGNTEVTYRADTKQYILKKIAEALNA